MGLFDGTSDHGGTGFLSPGGDHHHHRHHHHRSPSRNRGVSPARSTRSAHTTGGGTGYYVRSAQHHGPSHASRPGPARRASGSLFGARGGAGPSPRSIFGGGGGGSSYYKRSPRKGYIAHLMHKLQRMLRELWHFARRHPVKAFFALVVPLLSAGGAIHGLMRQVGIRMPFGLDGGMSRGGGGYYGSHGYDSRAGGGGGGGGLGGWMDHAGGLMQIARAFM